jgi:hypothetical protein
MGNQASSLGDWQAVIAAHPLESHDPQAWLHYGVALLQTIQPGLDAPKQQQQAALAFVQAATHGASAAAVAAAQRDSLLMSLQQALAGAGLEQPALQIQAASAAKRGWQDKRSQVCEALVRGAWQQAEVLLKEGEPSPQWPKPPEVEPETWAELLLNSCAAHDRRLPSWWLVESRSLPRSGHHYLKCLLEQACGNDFSYCEGYQEPGCCKNSPCNVLAYGHFAKEHLQPHLRLLKSHDFLLSDATFPPPPAMVRLIQVRRPLNLLVSWLELEQLALNQKLLRQSNLSLERIFLYHEAEFLEEAWRLIDHEGMAMSAEVAEAWLEKKVAYVIGFLSKWLPRAQPFPFNGIIDNGNYVLRYEDLGRNAEILKAFSLMPPDEMPLHHFKPPHPDVMKRRSSRVAKLIESSQKSLHKADKLVMDALSSMQQLYL